MTEDYLHYIWKYKLFSQQDLKTTEGEPLEIIHFGFHNHDSGPDFSQGKVKVGDTLWAGNIEIHINASDWLKHKHQSDKAYDTVVLHVVYEADLDIKTTQGSSIPTLELKNRIDPFEYEKYEQFIFSSFPCANQLSSVPRVIISSSLDQMLTERLMDKSEGIKQELERQNFNWEQVFFQYIAKAMGMKINSFPMEQVAKNIDVRIVAKLGDDLLAIESLLFGQAGFLEINQLCAYGKELKKEFDFQREKHNLVPIQKVSWKLSKLRPPNFPTVRLAQLARLLQSNPNLFNSLVVQRNTCREIQTVLSVSIHDGFWKNHYTFEKESSPKIKSIGKSLIDSIVINTIAPFIYTYGVYKDQQDMKEAAIDLLEEVKPENNKITRLFLDKVGIESAADSQGIIQCHNEYCSQKKCLECSIGVYLLK